MDVKAGRSGKGQAVRRGAPMRGSQSYRQSETDYAVSAHGILAGSRGALVVAGARGAESPARNAGARPAERVGAEAHVVVARVARVASMDTHAAVAEEPVRAWGRPECDPALLAKTRPCGARTVEAAKPGPAIDPSRASLPDRTPGNARTQLTGHRPVARQAILAIDEVVAGLPVPALWRTRAGVERQTDAAQPGLAFRAEGLAGRTFADAFATDSRVDVAPEAVVEAVTAVGVVA